MCSHPSRGAKIFEISALHINFGTNINLIDNFSPIFNTHFIYFFVQD